MTKDIRPEIRFIPEYSREWNHMWDALGQLPVNRDQPSPVSCFHEASAEVWQYMGTVATGGKWVHEFRHRCHPATNERMYVRVPHSGRAE